MSSDVKELSKKEIVFIISVIQIWGKNWPRLHCEQLQQRQHGWGQTQEAFDDDDVNDDVNDDYDVTGSEDDNCWSQEDDQITAQYQTIRKIKDRDTISQMSIESSDSSNQQPIFFQVRVRASSSSSFWHNSSPFRLKDILSEWCGYVRYQFV